MALVWCNQTSTVSHQAKAEHASAHTLCCAIHSGTVEYLPWSLLLMLARHANLSAGDICYRSSAVIQKIPEPELGRDLWREYRRWVAFSPIGRIHTVQGTPSGTTYDPAFYLQTSAGTESHGSPADGDIIVYVNAIYTSGMPI